ncbi:hypothetical protein BGZ76_002430, partial [Entomortierella beljakovae]
MSQNTGNNHVSTSTSVTDAEDVEVSVSNSETLVNESSFSHSSTPAPAIMLNLPVYPVEEFNYIPYTPTSADRERRHRGIRYWVAIEQHFTSTLDH